MPRTKSRPKTLTLDAKTLTALRTLVDYTFDDERRDYYTCEPDERSNHIYGAIKTLALATAQLTPAELAADEAEDVENRA